MTWWFSGPVVSALWDMRPPWLDIFNAKDRADLDEIYNNVGRDILGDTFFERPKVFYYPDSRSTATPPGLRPVAKKKLVAKYNRKQKKTSVVTKEPYYRQFEKKKRK